MITQPTARAMRGTLRHIAQVYLREGAVQLDDMKFVWKCLDIAAREEEGAELYAHERRFLALMAGETVSQIAAE